MYKITDDSLTNSISLMKALDKLPPRYIGLSTERITLANYEVLATSGSTFIVKEVKSIKVENNFITFWGVSPEGIYPHGTSQVLLMLPEHEVKKVQIIDSIEPSVPKEPRVAIKQTV